MKNKIKEPEGILYQRDWNTKEEPNKNSKVKEHTKWDEDFIRKHLK